MKIQNPHDKFFKETFGKVEVAKDFLYNYLPQSIIKIIDVDTLEPQKDSFINEKLQESFSDLLFKVSINKREGYIYFLFEHKSYPSQDIAIQLLRYMAEIWDVKIKKKKTYRLPVIIPLVIYHGKDSWNIKTTLGEMINGYRELPKKAQSYVPNYKYLLYDLSGYTNEEIKGEVINKIAMTIMRDIQKKDINAIIESVLKAAIYLRELEDKRTGIEYFETLVRYIFNARADLTKADFNKMVEKIEIAYPEGSEVVMTLAEMFREEGVEIGARKKEIEVVKNALNEGMELNLIVKLTGLPKKEVEKIAKEIDN